MYQALYVICQGHFVLTPTLTEKEADLEKERLSEWFTGLIKVKAAQLEQSYRAPERAVRKG